LRIVRRLVHGDDERTKQQTTVSTAAAEFTQSAAPNTYFFRGIMQMAGFRP
jgi:hypothetical protein